MRHRLSWDPVADWDGRCTTGMGSCRPEELQEVCRRNMEAKETDIRINREDDEAKRTPVGAVQYHYMDIWSPTPVKKQFAPVVPLAFFQWKEKGNGNAGWMPPWRRRKKARI